MPARSPTTPSLPLSFIAAAAPRPIAPVPPLCLNVGLWGAYDLLVASCMEVSTHQADGSYWLVLPPLLLEGGGGIAFFPPPHTLLSAPLLKQVF